MAWFGVVVHYRDPTSTSLDPLGVYAVQAHNVAEAERVMRDIGLANPAYFYITGRLLGPNPREIALRGFNKQLPAAPMFVVHKMADGVRIPMAVQEGI